MVILPQKLTPYGQQELKMLTPDLQYLLLSSSEQKGLLVPPVRAISLLNGSTSSFNTRDLNSFTVLLGDAVSEKWRPLKSDTPSVIEATSFIPAMKLENQQEVSYW